VRKAFEQVLNNLGAVKALEHSGMKPLLETGEVRSNLSGVRR